jgi:hypothetical protein
MRSCRSESVFPVLVEVEGCPSPAWCIRQMLYYGATTLDLHRLGLTALPTGLGRLTNIEDGVHGASPGQRPRRMVDVHDIVASVAQGNRKRLTAGPEKWASCAERW